MQTANTSMKRHNIGMTISMGAYVAILFSSVFYLRHNDAGNHLKVILAILTSIPIGGSIYVFMRYLKECDEFIRGNLSENFIIAAGITFFLSATWGFLESFANFPRFDMYWIYVIFWFNFGIVSFARKIR